MDPAPHAGGERPYAFPEAIEADLLARADKNHMAVRPRREQGRQLAPETTLPQPGGVPHGKGHDLLSFRQFTVPETESAGGVRSEKLRVHTLPQYGNEPAHPFGVLLPLPFRRRKMAVTIKKVFRLQRVADIAGGQGDVGHSAERIAGLGHPENTSRHTRQGKLPGTGSAQTDRCP